MNVKTYSSKSNAARAAKKAGVEVTQENLIELDGRFAYVGPVDRELLNEYGETHCPHCGVHLSNGVANHGDDVNGGHLSLEKFQHVCLACDVEFGPKLAKKPKKDSKSTGRTVDKVRREQHGLKEPSRGTVGRTVWDACDEFFASTKKVPTPTDVKLMADALEIKHSTAVMRLYLWRRFHGHKGRA